MANWNDDRTTQQGFGMSPSQADGATGNPAMDLGLRKYMLGVYNYMASAVLLTGVVAMLFSQTGLVYSLFNPATGAPTLFYWVMVAAPFLLVMWLQFRIFHMSLFAAQASYWIYATLIGISTSAIFLVYTSVSIAQTFFATAAAFAGLSLWGYTTKKDLSGWGTFLVMGIWGMIGASLLNVLIFKSGMFDLLASGVMVVLFAAFTAYKTQETREIYYQVRGNAELMAKTTIYGALHLYMAFVSMFLNLLRFMGVARD